MKCLFKNELIWMNSENIYKILKNVYEVLNISISGKRHSHRKDIKYNFYLP